MQKNIIILFYLLVFSLLAHAGEQALPSKSSPPYPNVWGYDLSEYPAVKWGLAGKHAYRMEDGDIWFIITYSYKTVTSLKKRNTDFTDYKYILLKFFKGEQIELNEEEAKKLRSNLRDKKLITSEKVNFKNGSTLKTVFKSSPKLCFIPDFQLGYMLKTDVNGLETKYSILGASTQVEMISDMARCEHQGSPFLYQRLYLLYKLIDLGDDTFIAFTDGSNLILRFNKNLETKFKPVTPVRTRDGNIILRNFFVIDYAIIEDLKSKNILKDVPLSQTIHDELIEYFKKQYS
ncbi:MAG: hypothetical protein ACHQJ6_01970 [Candidatus Berkiellales bacterium]